MPNIMVKYLLAILYKPSKLYLTLDHLICGCLPTPVGQWPAGYIPPTLPLRVLVSNRMEQPLKFNMVVEE